MPDQDPYAAIAQPITPQQGNTDPYAAIATPDSTQSQDGGQQDPYAAHAQPITQPINPHAVQSAAPVAEMSAHKPTFVENLKAAVGNSAIGRSLESTTPGIADFLGIHSTAATGAPGSEQDANQLVAPEYLARGMGRAKPSDPATAEENVATGVGRAVGGLTTPGNMALMAAPIGAVAGVFGKTAGMVLPRLLSAGFTLQMAKGLYDQSKEFRAAMDRGDVAAAEQIAGEAAVTAPMAVLAGTHAVKGGHVAPGVPETDYGIQSQEHPIVTGAKYIAAVKSGIAPANAAADLGMTPEYQEMAHVAEALIPKTMAEAAKSLQPPAPKPPEPASVPRPIVSPDGATVQKQQQTATIAETAARAQAIDEQARKIALGIPPPKPPEVPLPSGMDKGELTKATVDQTAQLIQSLPEAQRPVAQREAAGNLARWGFEQKTPIGPDGKLSNIDSPKGAQTWAVQTINDEIDRQTKVAAEKAEADKAKADEAQIKAEQAAKDIETARQERQAATEAAAGGGQPEVMPDTPLYAQVRAALDKAPPDMTKADLVMAARRAASVGPTKGILTPRAAESLANEHIAKRAQQEAAATLKEAPDAETQLHQHPIALQKWASDVANGRSPFLHVAKDSTFKPDLMTGKTDGFTKTSVKNALVDGFNGTYYHPKDIRNSEIRAAATSDNPAAALQQLEADWKSRRTQSEKPTEEQGRAVLSDSTEQTQLGNPVPLNQGKPLAGVNGKETQVLTSSRKLPARYRLAEADDLVPSHNAHNFSPDPRYPQGVQERDYEKSKEAQSRVISQGQNYDPAYTVNTNPDTVNGPPVVTPDGVVLGGNSRTMSTQRMYAETDGAAYRKALREQAEQFGLTREQVDQMKNPVLVRQVEAPKNIENARRLGSEMNKSMTGALGVSERAVSAGKNLKPQTLTKISDMLAADDSTLRELMGRRGPELVRMMVDDGVITERERPQFVDAGGELSDEGKTFFERALLGSVVGDSQLLDAAPKGILAKLERSLGSIASFSSRPDRWNIIPALREALAEHVAISRSGTSVEDRIGQASMFGPDRNPLVDAIVRKLAEKPNSVREAFTKYAEDADANAPGQSRMFGGGESFDAFNHAFGSNLSEEDFHDGLTAAAKVEPAQEVSQRGEGGQGSAGIPESGAGAAAQAGKEGASRSDKGRVTYSVEPLEIKYHNTGSALEKKIEEYTQKNGQELVQKLLSEHRDPDGVPVIATDAAKFLFPDYKADPTGTENDVRGSAHAIQDAALRTVLAQPVDPNRPDVLISTGTPASGKTSGQASRAPSVALKYETLMTDYDNAAQLVQQVIDSGRNPVVNVSFLDNPAENVRRMIDRAVGTDEAPGIKRTVPLSYMTKAFIEIPKVVERLRDNFGDKIKFNSIDNSGAPGDARLYTGIEPVIENAAKWTRSKLQETLYGELDKLNAEGKVPADIFKRANEGRPVLAAGEGNRAGDSGRAEQSSAEPAGQVLDGNRRNPSNTFYSNPLDPELIKRYIGEPLMKMAEPLRAELERQGKVADVANTTHDLLQNLDRTNKATTLEAKALTKAMERAGFSKEDGAEVYKHLEDPSVPLTEKQVQLRDEWIKPLNQATRMQYVITELIKSGKFKLDDIMSGRVPENEISKVVSSQENYQHRIPVEKDTFVDRILGDSLKRFRAPGGTLSRMFSSAKRSVFKEIHGPNGEREVVAVKNGRVTQFINKDNADVLDDKIAAATKALEAARKEDSPEPARIESLKGKLDELNAKRQEIADDGHTALDLGEHLAGYISTKELADKAVIPLEKKLAEMKAEFQTLHGSQTRAIASQQRIENLYYQIDETEKQISAVRASVGPEEEAVQGMTRQEALNERVKPLQEQIERLTQKQQELAGRETLTPGAARTLKGLPDAIQVLKDRIDAIGEEMAGTGLEGKYWQDKNGGLWKFDRGTTEFISDRTGQKYHADARLSGLINYMETNKAMNAAVVLERSKSLLEANSMGAKIQNTKDIPHGWKPTSLQQMQGYYFPAHIADAFDQFHYLQQRGAPNVLEKANNFVIQSVLMNPLAHGINIASNWFTGRAAEALSGRGISPRWYAENVKAGTEAVNLLREMGGDEYQRLLRLGLDLRGADTSFDNRTKEILRSFTEQLGEDRESNKLLSALIGVKDAAHWLQTKNHQVTFGLGDLALAQSFYAKRAELIRNGVPSAEEAARDWAHRMVGEYTTPVRLAGSAGLGRLAEKPMAQSFFRYHFGYILRPMMDSIRESIGPDSLTFKPSEETSSSAGKDVNQFNQTPAQQRSLAIARLAVMAAMATYVFPKVLDEAAKKITGDDRAVFPRGGLLKFGSDIYETATGERSMASLANSVFTPALGTMKAMQLFTNMDTFSGRHIYGSDQDAAGKAKQMGEWLIKGTLPGQTAGRMDQSGLRQVVESLVGFRFPLQHGIKAATEIRRDEGGKNPPDPQATRVFGSIMAAAAQSHHSNGQDTTLRDALLASGKLTEHQEKTLEQACEEPPIVFAVKGLEKPQDYWRVFEAGTDQEKTELLDADGPAQKLYTYQQQLREEGKVDEADKVLRQITRN